MKTSHFNTTNISVHFQAASAEQEGNRNLYRLLEIIAASGKQINRQVLRAPLTGIGSHDGRTNVHGDMVKELDMYAHHLLVEHLSSSGLCCAIVSEEEEEVILTSFTDAPYIVHMDPLDGSSNIDTSVAIGSIFSIYERISKDGPVQEADIMQPGKCQKAAAYLLYSSACMFVFSIGMGVKGFTLDPEHNEFILSHPFIQIPQQGNIYSVNEGNYMKFDSAIYEYIQYCKTRSKEEGGVCSARYIGSMVADLHRSLIKGGVFMYPSSTDLPHGKLRLTYECSPFAFLVEQAGGRAIDCYQNPVLEIIPENLHQKSSIIIGSELMVSKAEVFMAQYAKYGLRKVS